MSNTKIIQKQIELPLSRSIIDYPGQDKISTTVNPSELIGIFNPAQKIISIAKLVDPNKLVEAKASRGVKSGNVNSPYTMEYLKKLSKSVGVSVSLRRPEMVKQLRAKIYGDC